MAEPLPPLVHEGGRRVCLRTRAGVMCGIAGLFAYAPSAPAPAPKDLDAAVSRMAARGPDGTGTWRSRDGRVLFGHRRLSIIDPSERAAQPMESPDGALVVVFNGEIYNHRALRAGLEARGRVFRSDSDTEVLLYLYAERGAAMVDELRGMFAFAVWDAREQRILLARDPHGIKPLYCADDGRTFRFASQVKALLAGGVSRSIDPAGLAGFLVWGSVPEPWTIHAAIRELPAGSTRWVDARGASPPRRFFDLAAVYREAAGGPPRSAADALPEMREALRDTVGRHLVADVPVGAFLSAGIDSGALVALMREATSADTRTVTLAFDEFHGHADDEAPLAAEMAARCGTDHTTRRVDRDEFERDLPRILDAMDQPSIDGINTWFASKAARERGLKVAVSGLGGDELWGGYPSFRDVPRWVGIVRWPARVPGLGRALREVGSRVLPATPWSPKLAGLVEHGNSYPGAYFLRRGIFMPWELGALFDREQVDTALRAFDPVAHAAAALEPDPGTPFARVATLESALYLRNQLLRDTDWASMAHSLEVRTPLVDAALLRRVAPLVARGGTNAKALLAQCPSRPLPDAIARRAKTGFTTPIARWVETSPALDAWKRVPSLARPHCHWSRRFAYVLARTWLDGAAA